MTLLVRTPREWLGPPRREVVTLDGRALLIERPTDTDATLEPAGGAKGRYMPYWVDLWPGARMLAKWLVWQSWPAGLRALEVGCGLGLAGVTALSMGLRVTFSDCDATALEFAEANARLNGFWDFDTLQLDWDDPPEVRFPLILGSDLIYEDRHVGPLLALAERMLTDDGVFVLTDLGRVTPGLLVGTLEQRGLPFTASPIKAVEPGGRRYRGALYRIGRRQGPEASGGA